jgi:hypothetical protein
MNRRSGRTPDSGECLPMDSRPVSGPAMAICGLTGTSQDGITAEEKQQQLEKAKTGRKQLAVTRKAKTGRKRQLRNFAAHRH